MGYSVEYAARAVRELKKTDSHIRALIISWIEKNLVDCDTPRLHGKPLAANRSGEWRYRIGDYRVLANIFDDKLLILIIGAGHRKNIYDI